MRSRTLFLFLLLLLGLLGLWIVASLRSNQETLVSDRPNDPWVFRSVLDKKPRMITFALNNKLWVAYSTDSCSLYKAWAGSVDFEGAVYNMRHGPQPVTVGNAWFENQHNQPWKVEINGKSESPKTDYKGHRYTKKGHAEIMYDLVLSDGKRIRINEQPEFVERDRQPGFQRTFTVSGAPEGAKITLKTNAGSVADVSNVETNGEWKPASTRDMQVDDNFTAKEVDGEIVLLNNKTTSITTMFINKPLYANPFTNDEEEEAAANITPGEKLIAKSDCRTCHNAQVKTVGPSYADISEKYKNTPANQEMLVQKVIKGGTGVWGAAAMSAHPDLMPNDALAMVSYILGLDEGEDDGEGGTMKMADLATIPTSSWLQSDAKVMDSEVSPGLLAKVYVSQKTLTKLADVDFNASPVVSLVAPNINAGGGDFSDLKDNFAIKLEGFIYLEKDDNVLLQLSSDDGSKLWLNDRLLIDNDGLHGGDPMDVEVALRGGYHRLRLEYFQGGGGKGISLKWARPGSKGLEIIPQSNFASRRADLPKDALSMGGSKGNMIPGDGAPLLDVHPGFTLSQARPETFLPKVSGMDFMSDGRLVVTTWDAVGGVYLLEGVQTGDPSKIKVKLIAKGLAEPLGVKVVNDTIFVLQKQELTKLVDTDGDDIIDEYQCFAKGWKASANFHEFAFGLAYKDGHFYATLAIAILPGGASARPQIPDRGKVLKISHKDGSIEFIARGLRTPNGIALGPDNELFVADNQGDWLPASKILHVKPNAFFNSYAVDSIAVANMPVQQPVVWLPQDEIGNSPTQPALLNVGPYKNQLIHGDVCYGGLQRVFVEKVNGDYQGCVFKFTQGLEAGTNRLSWGPDGALYVGGIGNPGNWGQEGKFWYGLQRMEYNGISAFEMLAVRAKANGMEIEFTEPLPEGQGWDVAHYQVQQWWYKPTIEYGGPKIDQENLTVKSASVSTDRKKVFLELAGMKPGHVVYIRLRNLPLSEMGHELWTTETWYTLNNIPSASGTVTTAPAVKNKPNNTLSDREKAEGWELLFDGKSMNGWHNYGKKTIGNAWVVDQEAIHLLTKPLDGGAWQQKDGGDILTASEYQDFELTLEWKIGPCGNSGIIYNVVEDPEKYSYVWETGPEMQVLDNSCHPDARIQKHRAGDLYDLIECKYVTVKPAGEWNKIRLISKNGTLEHWQNDRKLVTVDMNAPEWEKLIAGSKFKDMPAFGKSRKGRIALQDHGDPVWYRNVKIKKL